MGMSSNVHVHVLAQCALAETRGLRHGLLQMFGGPHHQGGAAYAKSCRRTPNCRACAEVADVVVQLQGGRAHLHTGQDMMNETSSVGSEVRFTLPILTCWSKRF